MPVTLALAVRQCCQHSHRTCGMSCRGGLIPSQGERRSMHFGRVAVMHVQGSPKDGGALGSLRGINARLSPVPPDRWGQRVRRIRYRDSLARKQILRLAVARRPRR